VKNLITLWAIAAILLFSAPIVAQEGETPPATAEAPVPAAPPAPAKKKGGPVTINFVDMELSEIITNISKITGKNFIWDEKVRGKVTIISPTGIPVDEAYRVFEAVLRFNGFQLVPVPGVKNLFKIMRIQEINGQPIPTYLQGGVSPPTEAYVTRLIPLQYLDVNEATNVLNNLKSNEGKIIPYTPTNTIIIIESANNLNRLLRILGQMDIPMRRPAVKIIKLKYAPSDQLAGELNQIFAEGAIGLSETIQPAPTPIQPGQPPQPQGRAEMRRTTTGARNPSLKIISDTRTNSLIIIAMADLMDEVLRVIDQLDISVQGEEGIYVYYCRNAGAKDLAGTLTSLAGAGAAATGSTRRTATGTQMGGQPSTAPTAPGVPPPPPIQTPTASTSSQHSVVNIGILGAEVRITADEPTNSLVIVASKQDYAILLQVIKKLDIRRKQVFVEAVIIEVELDKSNSIGASFAITQNIQNNAAVFESTALGGLNSLSILPALQAGTFTSALPGGFSIGAMTKTVTINIGGTPIEIPTFSALFNALVANNNVNVLSTPNLLTTDNEEAEIVVGQNVPLPTGSTTAVGGVTTTTIERQNIGIKLKVKPQISESDTVRMVLSTEISGVAQSAVAGIDVNTLGITTTIKSAQTTVVVDNNQTVVIGGLIQERETETWAKVPLLGDIPVLGWLFRSHTKEKDKTNLVILLTPHIVRNAADLSAITTQENRRRKRFLEESTGETYHEPFYLEPLLLPETPPSESSSPETPVTVPPTAPTHQPPAPTQPPAVPAPPQPQHPPAGGAAPPPEAPH